MTTRIALVSTLKQELQDELTALYDVQLSSYNHRREALAEEGADIDVVYGNVRPFELPALPRLKWIHATWAGIENLCYPEMAESGVMVTNVRGASADAMSEHAVMGLLYFLRDVPCHAESNHERSWKRSPTTGLLTHATVMVLGTGGVGQRIVQILNAFGARVIGVNSDGHAVDGCTQTCPMEAAPSHLPKADHLVCALPLTPFTEGLIDATWFDLLKPHGILVNISRGKVINEADLIVALETNTIRGACLDVTAEEPLPADSPLWHTPSVFITGHRSYLPGHPTASPAFEVFKENLGHFLAGRTQDMINVINFAKGY